MPFNTIKKQQVWARKSLPFKNYLDRILSYGCIAIYFNVTTNQSKIVQTL